MAFELNPFPSTTVLASIINIIAAAAAAVTIIPIVVIAMGQLFPPERPNCSSLQRWSGLSRPQLFSTAASSATEGASPEIRLGRAAFLFAL